MELTQESISWGVGIFVAVGTIVIGYLKLDNKAAANHAADLQSQGKFRDDLMKQVGDMRERVTLLEKRCERLDHNITLLLFALDNVAAKFPETEAYVREQKETFLRERKP